MAEQSIPLIDRLKERGFIDRWAFLAFAIVGGLGIVVAKYLGLAPGWTAAGAALLMVGFAALVDLKGTGKLRGDQAGDNCYYLGLIYTLSSLSYAIMTFDPADTATTIVQGFGIALLTTILGLVLRVFFNQSRVDLFETEDTARLELADAAGRLKNELSQITVSMNDFAQQTRQSLEEMRDASVEHLSTGLQSALATIETVTSTARQTAETQAEEAGTRAKQLTAASGRMIASLERHGSSIERLSGSNEAIEASLRSVEAAAQQTQSSLRAMRVEGEQAASIQADLLEGGNRIAAASERLGQSVGDLSAALQEIQTGTQKRFEEIRRAPTDAVDAAVTAIQRAVVGLEAQFTALTEAQRRASDALASDTNDALDTARRHNDALESELERSRANVGKVYDALVEMTSDLVRHVKSPALQ